MQSKDNKEDDIGFSSPRKKLLEAKQKDAYFEKEVSRNAANDNFIMLKDWWGLFAGNNI